MKIFKKIICCLALFVLAIATSATVVGCKEKEDEENQLLDNAIVVIDKIEADYDRITQIDSSEFDEELENYWYFAEFVLPVTKILIQENKINNYYEIKVGEDELGYTIIKLCVVVDESFIKIQEIDQGYERKSIEDEFTESSWCEKLLTLISYQGTNPIMLESFVYSFESYDAYTYNSFVLATDEIEVFDRYERVYESDNYLHYDLISDESVKHLSNDSMTTEIEGDDLTYCETIIANTRLKTNNIICNESLPAGEEVDNFVSEFMQSL